MRSPETGELYHENVGLITRSGKPEPREREALEDIEKKTGSTPGFTPYYP